MKLSEIKYDHDRFPDGIKQSMLVRMFADIARQLKLKETWVNFSGPGMGTKLPGTIEVIVPGAHLKQDDLELEVMIGVLHHIVKKAFKAHLNLDVTVHPAKARRTDTGSKLSTVMITCEVEP